MPPTKLPELLSVAEVAKLMRCSKRTVHDRIADGTLKGIKPFGRWLVFVDSLAALVGQRPERKTSTRQSQRDMRRADAAMARLGVRSLCVDDYLSPDHTPGLV